MTAVTIHCSFSVKVKSLSGVQLFVIPWTVAYQAPLSMGFSRQECWSGLPFPTPGDLPDSGIEPTSLESPALAADSLPLSYLGRPFDADQNVTMIFYSKKLLSAFC